ncbi:hypothetical protein WN48_02727 [Eufriesea mexicana]|uniref:Uncharacterized protein n=1 Tax=Eufriesea mexicana TaxID=516756 RepID=A0A310SFQ6_9HYME|nr:hypothetical protein WN48_02727 [Eufriesea mexicana]
MGVAHRLSARINDIVRISSSLADTLARGRERPFRLHCEEIRHCSATRGGPRVPLYLFACSISFFHAETSATQPPLFWRMGPNRPASLLASRMRGTRRKTEQNGARVPPCLAGRRDPQAASPRETVCRSQKADNERKDRSEEEVGDFFASLTPRPLPGEIDNTPAIRFMESLEWVRWLRTGLPGDKTGDRRSFGWRNGEGSRLEEATDHFLLAFYPQKMIRAFDEWPDRPLHRLGCLTRRPGHRTPCDKESERSNETKTQKIDARA